jgi:hypothetical protein
MTTPQRSIEDVIVDVVKLIALSESQHAKTFQDHRMLRLSQVVDDILPLNEDETLDLLDTLAESLPKTLHKSTSQALSWRFYSCERGDA